MGNSPNKVQLASGWYVLCYHDIANAERLHLRGIGITHSVDQFERHLDCLSEVSELVSPQNAMTRLSDGDDTPMVSFSFDDGYRGVLDHAKPLLDRRSLTAIAAINSTFADGAQSHSPQGVFWRSQLCWLRHKGKLPELASRLKLPVSTIRNTTMDHYSPALVAGIAAIYCETEPTAAVLDRQQMHLTWDEIRELADAKWVIANHSANHYPLLESAGLSQLEEEHNECEKRLSTELGETSSMWVAPFDRPAKRAPQAIEQMLASASGRDCVIVGDRVTHKQDLQNHLIHRINAPTGGAGALLGALTAAANRSFERSERRNK